MTEVGASGESIDDLPSDLASLRAVSQQLVVHYMGNADSSDSGSVAERISEADTRYAEDMFARILEMGPPTLSRKRRANERLVGCCRDFTVLFVAMARHKGFSARARVGYATYFAPGWFIDHVIAEVWHAGEGRWRLVEPEIRDDFVPAGDGGTFDPLDVPTDRFVTGPRAWLAARSELEDPERFVVSPELAEPYTRGWLSLRHHLVQDLFALNKAEMLVWDQWGILDSDDPLDPSHVQMLDRLAQVTSNPDCSPAEIRGWAERDGLRLPRTVTSYSPAHSSPVQVEVSRVLASLGPSPRA